MSQYSNGKCQNSVGLYSFISQNEDMSLVNTGSCNAIFPKLKAFCTESFQKHLLAEAYTCMSF